MDRNTMVAALHCQKFDEGAIAADYAGLRIPSAIHPFFPKRQDAGPLRVGRVVSRPSARWNAVTDRTRDRRNAVSGIRRRSDRPSVLATPCGALPHEDLEIPPARTSRPPPSIAYPGSAAAKAPPRATSRA